MRGVALWLACAGMLAAQDRLPLSLRKSVEIALAPDGNTRVALAKEQIAAAEARRSQARSALLPSLDGQVSYQDVTRNLQAFGIQFPALPGMSFPTFVGPFGIFDARLSATQNLLDMASVKRWQAAKGAVAAAKLDQSAARTQTTDHVARAYLTALRAEARLDAARANVKLAEALRNLAETQRQAGTGTGIEVVRGDVQLANERQRLQVMENDRNRAHLQLLRAMDLQLDSRLELTDKLTYGPVEPISVEQALKQALDARPDWKAQEQRERVARLNQSAVDWERAPSVAAFGDYGAIGTEIGSSRATRAVGVAVRVPLFSGGRREARSAESRVQVRSEALRTRDLRQQVELDLRLAFDSLASADLQVKTAEEGLQLAQRELEQAQRRYKAGLTSSLEVTDAQTRLVRAQDNRIAALYQHNLARVELGSAVGAVERYLP
jgi:outer membrane protein